MKCFLNIVLALIGILLVAYILSGVAIWVGVLFGYKSWYWAMNENFHTASIAGLIIFIMVMFLPCAPLIYGILENE